MDVCQKDSLASLPASRDEIVATCLGADIGDFLVHGIREESDQE